MKRNKRFNLSFFELVLLLILIFGLFIRIFNLDRFLGFYFDQGRDALVIWDFIKSGKLFLIGPTIGPTMGVGDVPRGPWYLWLLIPFYWLGKGNPVIPAYFLVFSQVFSFAILYFVFSNLGEKIVAFFSLFISVFSFSLILSSHWLSNPTFLYFLSVLFLWFLLKIADEKRWAFLASGFLSGLAIHFGGSADIFYPLTAFLVAFIWSRKLINLKNIFYFFFFYCFSLLPQIIFDIRHSGIIRKGLWQFINSSRSFNFYLWDLLPSRISLYLDTFSEVVWGQRSFLFVLFFIAIFLFAIFKSQEIKNNKYFQVILISVFIPLVGMLFIKGEKGIIYGYYFTGFYIFWIVFFSFLLKFISKGFLGKVVIFFFLSAFLVRNLYLVSRYFKYDYRKYNPIILEDQLLAIDWIYKDAADCNFNVDFYVPPVIPYAYDYLFKWYGFSKYGCLPKEENVKTLYTLSEKDDSHPERLSNWLMRQGTIGKVEKETIFGNIKIERRVRI